MKRQIAALIVTLLAGCSLLFDGNDLHGRSGGGGNDMAAGGSGGGGDVDMAGSGGSGGTGGTGGGGGTAACTPKTSIKLTVTHPTVAGAYPSYVAAGDINGDGNADIVTSNYGDSTFSVMLSDGKGGLTLAATTPIATCTNPLDIVVADLDSDTKPDLVIACFDGTTAAVDVHINTSTTSSVSFMAPKPVGLPFTNKYFFPVVGRFGGTHPGLALVGANSIRIYTGPGDGTFPNGGATITAGMGADAAAVGDLNSDGKDDIVVSNYDDNDLTLALSASTGFTVQRLAYNVSDMGSAGGQVYYGGTPILVDYNGDGLKDIVIASGTSGPGDIYMFKNGGTATAPQFPVFGTTVDVGDEPLVVAMADFNCDGTLDLVASSNGCQPQQGCSGGPELWVLPGHGTGFDPRQTSTIDPDCDSFAIADFNGDGYLDIACGGGSNNPKAINLLLSTP